MTRDEIEILKKRIDTLIEVVFTDGERATIQLISVSASEGDIIYDVISSNRERRTRVSYLATFDQIESIGNTKSPLL